MARQFASIDSASLQLPDSVRTVQAANLKDRTTPEGAAIGSATVAPWAANTAYTTGQGALSPSGELITAITGFTSGASYDATKWNISAAPMNLSGTYASRPAATAVKAGTLYYSTDIPELYRSNAATWSVVGSGGSELGYAQSVSQATTTSTTGVDVAGLSITCAVGERPIKVIFDGVLRNLTVGVYARAQILVDGTLSATVGGPTALAAEYRAGHRELRVSGLTPGSSHTFKIQILAPTGGTTSLEGSPADPCFIQVVTL